MWSNSEKMAKNAYEFLFRQTEASKQRQSVPENPKKIGSICPDELIRLVQQKRNVEQLQYLSRINAMHSCITQLQLSLEEPMFGVLQP